MKQNTGPIIVEQVEIEAKLLLKKSDAIELLAKNADIRILLDSEAWEVKDIYLDSPVASLVSEDKLFRIRIYRNSMGSKTELAWKGPRLDKEIDTREDVSLTFENNLEEELIRFFARINYIPYLIINKRRREAKIGEYEFELDENLKLLDLHTNVEKGLGDFLSVCMSIPISYTSDDLNKGRQKVMTKLTALSNIAQLESRTFVDLFNSKK